MSTRRWPRPRGGAIGVRSSAHALGRMDHEAYGYWTTVSGARPPGDPGADRRRSFPVSTTRLPVEVELVYEVMSCNSDAHGPGAVDAPHPCTYFRSWGTYHSYDYTDRRDRRPSRGSSTRPGMWGARRSCRRCSAAAARRRSWRSGSTPTCRAGGPHRRRSLNPLFDDYRSTPTTSATARWPSSSSSEDDYRAYGGGAQDTPFSAFRARRAGGRRRRAADRRRAAAADDVRDLPGPARRAGRARWAGQAISSSSARISRYGNMVASPSAKWTTVPDHNDPTLPAMTPTAAGRHRHRVLPRAPLLPAPAVPEPSRGDPGVQPEHRQRFDRRARRRA